MSGIEKPPQDLLDRWKANVYDKGEQVDPFAEEDWHSLAVGWALGSGVAPSKAVNFADYLQAHTNLL